MNKNKLFNFVIPILFSLLFLSGASAAEKFPTKDIQVVIPNPPGGFIDIAVRFMNDSMKKNIGVPIIIDNRTGAGGATGTNYLIKSKPDGYTIGCISSANMVVQPATTPNFPFKYSDLDPLCKYAISSNMVFCKGDAPWKTLEEMVADAKKRPGQITYAVTTQSVSYFIMEGFLMDAGIKMKHIPMTGQDQVITRVLGGNIDIGIGGVANYLGQLKAGTIRALFVVTPERVSVIPQIPTLKEKGYQAPVIDVYAGFFAPHGMPKPIQETLVKALEKTIKDPTLKKKLDEIALVLDYLPAKDFAKELEKDYIRVTKLIEVDKPQR